VERSSQWASNRAKPTQSAPLLRCFRFRNHLSDQRLVDGLFNHPIASKFGLANCHFRGIVSVSRSVQSVNFARARGKVANSR
jgi:hypothetical protein